MLQTNRIPAIFQNRDENPPTYRHTPTFVKHSKRFYPSHQPPPHTSTSSTQHTITPTHHHPNTLNRPTLSTRGEASPRAAIARRAIHRSPLCGRSIAAPATPWLTRPNPTSSNHHHRRPERKNTQPTRQTQPHIIQSSLPQAPRAQTNTHPTPQTQPHIIQSSPPPAP